MSLAELFPIIMKASIALSVFSLGLETTFDDVAYLVRRPGFLLRSLVSMNVIVPVCLASLMRTFHLGAPVQIALLALAVSPVPPRMPLLTKKVASQPSYAVALLATMSVMSIVLVPWGVYTFGQLFGVPIRMRPEPIVSLMLVTILGPLTAGIVAARFLTFLDAGIQRVISSFATVVLVVGALMILFGSWSAVVAMADTATIVAIAAFIVVGLIAGHMLGGPQPQDRAVLAFASAFRHPGVALAIASETFPAQTSVAPAIVLYLLAGAIASQVYVRWVRR